MTDPSEPLPWPHGDAEATASPPSGFLWPSPPYAAYAQPQVQQGPQACEILGLNNSRSIGQLLQVDAGDRMVQINVPPARNSMPLKFTQFRASILPQSRQKPFGLIIRIALRHAIQIVDDRFRTHFIPR